MVTLTDVTEKGVKESEIIFNTERFLAMIDCKDGAATELNPLHE